ncbi:MAG: substrate-binding domain-containing protein [Clostridia bacterium]|nr:substrate-binding domain-containing protein [Clostridia bacterium]
MKKKLIFGLITLLGISLLVGCGGKTASEPKKEETTEKKVVVGFSQVTLDSPFYVALMDAAKAEAAKQGAELVYVDAQNDIEKQNNDVQDLITKGIDVLILNPSNPTGVNPALAAAKTANIPVVTVDRPTEQPVATFVGRDNKKMGELAGEQAVALLGGKGKAKGKIIEIQGDAGGKVMMDRRDGFHLAVEKEPGIKIIQGPYSDYTRSKAVKAFQDLLQANPDVNLVYAHNDDMALGALQVLQQNGLAGKVKIVGVDGLMEAIKAIETGNYDATVLNDPQLLGSTVVNTALGVLKGEKYPEFIDAGTGLITKENAAQYVDDKLVFAATKK